MLLNTISNSAQFDPGHAPGRLLVVVDTGGRPECGLFSGRHGGFTIQAEMDQRQPTLEGHEFSGYPFEVFEITRASVAPRGELRNYSYAVISWITGSYLSYPVGQPLNLTEHHPLRAEHVWEVAYKGAVVRLNDFRPQ